MIPAEVEEKAKQILADVETTLRQQGAPDGSAAIFLEHGKLAWGKPEAIAVQLDSFGYDKQANIVRTMSGPGCIVTVLCFKDGSALVSMITRDPIGTA